MDKKQTSEDRGKVQQFSETICTHSFNQILGGLILQNGTHSEPQAPTQLTIQQKAKFMHLTSPSATLGALQDKCCVKHCMKSFNMTHLQKSRIECHSHSEKDKRIFLQGILRQQFEEHGDGVYRIRNQVHKFLL